MSGENGHLSDVELGDLAAYADCSMPAPERERMATRIAGSSSLRGLVAEQRATIAAIAGADAPAPAGLRDRIEALGSTAEVAPTVSRRRIRLPRFALAGGLTAAVAGVALALILPAGATSLTIRGTSELAELGASAPPPGVDRNDHNLLAASVGGVAFPNYRKAFEWRRNGERADQLDDREITTVFYRREGDEIAYSIVAGDPLAWPADVRPARRGGLDLRTMRYEGASVVSWLRGGHTCVISSPDVKRDELLDLAAWMSDGAMAA